MPVLLSDIVAAAEELWPTAGAEEWDAVGLVCGDVDAPVERVVLAVDAVQATARETVDDRAQLLLVHHPLLMRGVSSVATDRYKGSILSTLIRNNSALYAAHTNADVVDSGTSGALASALGIQDPQPIQPSRTGVGGLGRVGRLAAPTRLGDLVQHLASCIPATAGGVRVAGDPDASVERVSVCGGAGDSLLSHPEVRSSDVYITSDLRHHPASESREQSLLTGGPALVDVSHWASESLWLRNAADELAHTFPDLTFRVSTARTDPWDFAVNGER